VHNETHLTRYSESELTSLSSIPFLHLCAHLHLHLPLWSLWLCPCRVTTLLCTALAGWLLLLRCVAWISGTGTPSVVYLCLCWTCLPALLFSVRSLTPAQGPVPGASQRAPVFMFGRCPAGEHRPVSREVELEVGRLEVFYTVTYFNVFLGKHT